VRYRIAFTPRAEKEFDDLPWAIQKRIARWPELLAYDPRGDGAKKREGCEELRRVHAGKDYVIVYLIRRKEVLVLIVRVGHRKDTYRGL